MHGTLGGWQQCITPNGHHDNLPDNLLLPGVSRIRLNLLHYICAMLWHPHQQSSSRAQRDSSNTSEHWLLADNSRTQQAVHMLGITANA
jgi:hypothetical protein